MRQRFVDAHVFDKAYHVEGSRLERFAWFRRKQGLHLRSSPLMRVVNFGVIHFFWDKILGTHRRPMRCMNSLFASSGRSFSFSAAS